MGIREMINKYRGATTVVLGLLIVVCVVWIWRHSGTTEGASLATQRFYTDDDGKTYFKDDALKITPFTHDGKEAVRAHVYDCGGTATVHYMERFTDVGRKAAAESLSSSGNTALNIPDGLVLSAYEFKRPGETKWQPRPPGPKPCPDGKPPQWVEP